MARAAKSSPEPAPEPESTLPPDARHRIARGLLALAVPVELLKPDPIQLRDHDEANLRLLAPSYANFGQQRPFVVDKDGVVKDGNGGFLACRDVLGWTHVAAVTSDLEGAVIDGYAITANRTYERGRWLQDNLRAKLQELGGALPFEVFSSIGYDEDDLARILGAGDQPPAPPSDDPGPPPDYAGGGDAGGLPPSAVRMVQLYLSAESAPEFMADVSALQQSYGTDNLTDTVAECVRRARADLDS